MSPAVEVRDLVKRYPKAAFNAVDGVTFTVEPGEVFGLLGPNGAGKTTTIGVLTTRVRATGGTASVGGVDVLRDPVAARSRLAVVPQRNNLDRSLSIRDNLLFHARYHGVPASERDERADALLAEFGLRERSSDKPDRFSGGQAQRVMIARALMHAPAVIFLDEPSTGLDPAARLFVWDRVRDLRERGVTVVLTTHDMDEAAALADRVGIMDRGELLALDTPEALTRSMPGSSTLDVTLTLSGSNADGAQPSDGARESGGAGRPPVDQLTAALADLPGVERVESLAATPSPDAPARLRLYVTNDAASLLAPVVSTVERRGAALTGVALGEPTLEDVFISLTGRALR
ncbi:MAG: ABC transporter ATP-binding protein [Actinomycetes bacterium]